jgi:predicted RNA binding protein YcfA (HicA-like mRNA interferase family)
MRVQEIAKILNKAGLRKKSTKRVDFKTVITGDYEARKFNYNGINCYILPVNGMKVETIIEILSKNGLNVENRKGYATVLK